MNPFIPSGSYASRHLTGGISHMTDEGRRGFLQAALGALASGAGGSNETTKLAKPIVPNVKLTEADGGKTVLGTFFNKYIQRQLRAC